MTVSTTPWWTKDTVAVVTGANRGIGYEIVRGLAQEGVTVVLTAQDQSIGDAAVDALKAKGLDSIWFYKLEVNSSESVQVLASWLKSKFGGVDILVNNAGVNSGPNGYDADYENATANVGTNYGGVKNVMEGLLPLLRPSPAGARIVNVSSRLGFYEDIRSVVPSQLIAESGSDLVVINFGSANLRIGLATGQSPVVVSHCTAHHILVPVDEAVGDERRKKGSVAEHGVPTMPISGSRKVERDEICQMVELQLKMKPFVPDQKGSPKVRELWDLFQ